jgi:hypothetical protein
MPNPMPLEMSRERVYSKRVSSRAHGLRCDIRVSAGDDDDGPSRGHST